jgi:sterol desaturase/sphingolipid hydroxylase (fatty acid hydroxylase superfamily)
MDAWVAHEAAIRYYALIAGFGLVAVWESLAPHRVPAPAVRGRWGVNIGLTLLLSAAVALVFPVLAVGAAIAAERSSLGVLNHVSAPAWLTFALAFLAMDLGRYATHVALHRVPWLWRLHRVHHSDMDYDCTTALRFHPLEALLTVGIQIVVVAAIGAPPLAVLAYEAIVAIASLFTHGNVSFAPRTDALLRRFAVTPAMHRIHHSTLHEETDSNFGVVLPWWDRLLGTYRAEPSVPHAAMTIGLADVRDARASRFEWLLASPFRREPAGT